MTESEQGAAPVRSKGARRLLWVLAVAAGLVALYAAAGFALLPWLIKTRLPEITQREIGHRASVGEVKFNPFKLVFEASDARLDEPDGSLIFGFKSLDVDLEWSSLFQRTWRLASVRLVAPRANLGISKEGVFNLADLIAALNRNPPKEPQPMPRLLVDRFELSGGRVEFNDRRAGYSNVFTPIEFSVSDFSTLPDHKGPYSFSASTARGGSIRWKGQASLEPIAGSGEVVLDALSLPDLAIYAKPLLDVTVASGKLGATLPYRFAYTGGKLSFDLEKAALKVADVNARPGPSGAPSVQAALLEIDGVDASLARQSFAVRGIKLGGLAMQPASAKEAAFKLAAVTVGDISGNAASGEVMVGSVNLSGGNLAMRRDARGQIDLLEFPVAAKAPLPAREQAAVAPTPAANPPVPATPAWKVGVKQVGLDNFSIAINDLSAPKPLQMEIGKVALNFALEVAQAPSGFNTVVSGAELSAREIVANGGSEAPVRIGEIGAGGGKLDLSAGSLVFERAWLRKADLKLVLDAGGRLNLLDMLPGPGSPPATPAKPDTAPFKVGVKSVEIAGINADFEDRGSGMRIGVQEAGAKLSGVSSNLSDPLDFDAGLRLREGGEVRAKGRVVPSMASVDVAVKVDRLALAPVQPLMARHVKLVLASGSVSADGKLQVGGKGGRVRYAGNVGLSDLLLNEEGGKQFAALKAGSAEGIAFQLGPDSLEVPELRLDALQAQLLIDADGSLNATRLLVQPAKPAAPPSGATVVPAVADPAPAARTEAASAAAVAVPAAAPPDPFPVAVRRLRISNAKLDFEDLSLRPQFGAKIHDLNGVVTGLSTSPATRSRLELDGRVDEFGLARIRGELNPFFPRNNTAVNVVFRNVDMTTATPYAMKFAGYKIAAGKISLDLNYKVRNSQLEGDNQVVIDQLTLGERVDSPDALKLPLELAIAILKDSNGRIDLGLPVSGSLDDPQFSYGAVIWKAVVNVLARIVTAPFRALGALFGGDGAKLESIDFDPGSAAILPPEREKLRQVAQVLAKREQLKLAIPGQYNEEADAPVLRESAMRREILGRAGIKLAEGEAPGPIDIGDKAQRTALREAFGARHGAAALEKLQEEIEQRATTPRAADAGPRPEPVAAWRRAIGVVQGEPNLRFPGAYYNTLVQRLAASQPLPPDALASLAGARAAAIAAALKEAGIDAARITQAAAEKTETRGKLVPLKLGLASR